MNRLILIVGMGHCGTTILDASLGCSPQVIGIGEAVRLLSDRRPLLGSNWNHIRDGNLNEIFCTCGESVGNCPVWSAVAFGLTKTTSGVSDLESRFSAVYSAAVAVDPGVKYVVDSTPGVLEYIDCLDSYDLRIIHITRDVRSWSVSRKNRRGTPVWLSQLIWAKNTHMLSKKISFLEAPIFQLGYEEFALRPEQSLGLLCDWLGIEYAPTMLMPFDSTGSHIIEGNPSILKRSLSNRIQYDGTWMADSSGAWVKGLIYSLLSKKNQKLVYSNQVVGHKK